MRTRSGAGEAGSTAVELTLLTPVLLVVLLFVVGLGRMAHARQQVESIAADAARAASLERDPARTAQRGREAAAASRDHAGLSCRIMDVDVDLTDYRPGGAVTVTVTCTADLADVAISGLPGARRFTARSVVPIESRRSGP